MIAFIKLLGNKLEDFLKLILIPLIGTTGFFILSYDFITQKAKLGWNDETFAGIFTFIFLLFYSFFLFQNYLEGNYRDLFFKWTKEHAEHDFDSEELHALPPTEPDLPCDFGHKQLFLVIQSKDQKALIEALQLENLQSINWQSGLQSSFSSGDQLFLSPSLDGFSFVMGNGLNPLGFFEALEPQQKERYEAIFKKISDAYLFSSFRNSSSFGWLWLKNGKVKRYLAVTDGQLFEEGEMTAAEEDIKHTAQAVFEKDFQEGQGQPPLTKADLEWLWIDEEQVFQVAEAWCLSPQNLAGRVQGQKSLGFIGTLNSERF
jgi:hypothetical protein